MKCYESRLAQVPGHILWTFCFYVLIAVLVALLFRLFSGSDNVSTTFLIIVAMWIGQSWRFHKMRYKINEQTLVQYDFQYRTIQIEQIVSVRVLPHIRWVSFHTPYNIVIATVDGQKYFIAPEKRDLLVEMLKKENPDIEIIK